MVRAGVYAPVAARAQHPPRTAGGARDGGAEQRAERYVPGAPNEKFVTKEDSSSSLSMG